MSSLAEKMKRENAQGDRDHVRKVKAGLDLSQKANDPQTYEAYFDGSLSIRHIKPHQILAVNRGEKLGFLTVRLNWTVDGVIEAAMQYIGTRCPSLTSTSIQQVLAGSSIETWRFPAI